MSFAPRPVTARNSEMSFAKNSRRVGRRVEHSSAQRIVHERRLRFQRARAGVCLFVIFCS